MVHGADIGTETDVQVDPEMVSLLTSLVVSKGIREEEMQHPERVTHIEMVLDDYCSMQALRYFSNLRTLCLIQQAIVKIEGLEGCHCLELLFLNENQISVIEGLGGCTQLQELHLCTNAIGEVGVGLTGLNQLTLLFIAENRITCLDGLALAPQLQRLNAARNRISSVSGSFDHNPGLVSISVADNHLCAFSEIFDFARLVNLRELNFADPDWGENPICSLCNYKTYVLYHLPCLEVHDCLRVTDEDHLVAATAFLKKRLYYNMRIKFTQRCAADCIRTLKMLHEEQLASLEKHIFGVEKTLRAIDSFSAAQRENPPGAQPSATAFAVAVAAQDRVRVHQQSRELQAQLDDASATWGWLCDAVRNERDALVRCLSLELQTGGNVRLEASLDASWARSLAELVQLRFSACDFSRFGIEGVRVHRVSRIHHRSLRLRFEANVGRLSVDSEPLMEYLFYVPAPENATAEMRRAAENGCQGLSAAALAPQNLCNGVLLTNSVSVVEVPRLEFHATTKVGKAVARVGGRAAGSCVSRGMLLVCSAHVGAAQPDTPASFAGNDARAAVIRDPSRGNLEESRALARALFRQKLCDPQQKIYLLPDATLALPEFFVEFDYIPRSGSVSHRSAPERETCGPFSSMVQDFAFLTSSSSEAASESSAEHLLPELLPVEHLDEERLVSCESGIVSCPDAASLASIVVLNLQARSIRRIDPGALKGCTVLRSVFLSHNSLESATSLPRSPTVTLVDVSFNLLQKVDAVVGLPALKHLDMGWNCLLSADDVLSTLAKDIPALEELVLVGNPLAKADAHRPQALTKLSLSTLDKQSISDVELQAARNAAFAAEAVLGDSSLMRRSFAATCPQVAVDGRRRHSPVAPFDWDARRNLIATMLEGDGSNVGRHLHGSLSGVRLSSANWKQFVETLDLRDMHLVDLCDLSGFSMVKRMLLDGNRLESLEGLTGCLSLEEVSIEGNALTSLRGASALKNLRRLDAGGNQISSILDLKSLAHLCQLSLEDNLIDSLDTVSSLAGLMELYLSNNFLEELRSVLMLKHLTRLTVLDLAGNSLCNAADYRLYTMFHLRRLKVLDGAPASPREQLEADTKFSGRLTMEMLEDKLGPAPACYNFRTVILSNLNLRELGQHLNDEMFPSLRELTLDGNPFTDMRSVGPLSKLMVLRMNRTKLDLEKGVLAVDQAGLGITAMAHLQVLELGACGITDLSHFARFPLPALRILHLPGNEITKLEGLTHLEQLRELVLDRNKVKQFDEHSFEGLRCLRELHAEDCGLRTLSCLGPLPRLRSLFLSSNRVSELAELEKLSNLRHVQVVHLSSTPVSRKPLYRAHLIHAVASVRVLDGKEITDEERERSEQLLAVNPPPCGVFALQHQGMPSSGSTAPCGSIRSGGGPGTHIANQAQDGVDPRDRDVCVGQTELARKIGPSQRTRSHSVPRHDREHKPPMMPSR